MGFKTLVSPSARLVIGSDDKHDFEYVPPGTTTLARASCATTATQKKMASGVVIASQYDEDCTVTGTPSE